MIKVRLLRFEADVDIADKGRRILEEAGRTACLASIDRMGKIPHQQAKNLGGDVRLLFAFPER
jgi:hypothetical protein